MDADERRQKGNELIDRSDLASVALLCWFLTFILSALLSVGLFVLCADFHAAWVNLAVFAWRAARMAVMISRPLGLTW